MSEPKINPMLRVAIIGCGKIADQHVEQILRIPGCEIVGVCDREELMAQQLQERLQAGSYFTEVRDLIEQSKPDVVHITTPPAGHFSLGKMCMDAGCHIYVEKPFTVNSDEAQELIALATQKNLRLTVGHNAQFSHASLRMRQIFAEGYLGGPPTHLEAYYCYNLSDPGYAKALLGDSNHWVRKLPGGLLHNIISHGISKIAEFLPGDAPEVMAYGFTSPLLQSIGETEIVDELRTVIHDGPMTAYFTFSSQMRPGLHQIRLYGPKNGLVVDDDQQTVVKIRGAAYKSYLEQFLPPWDYAKQYLGNSLGNMRKFLRADFQTNYGMKVLIQRFYESITANRPLPIPYPEILRTARIMDEIFSQLNSSRASNQPRHDERMLAEHR
jgi:predicted dehydrogenase